MNADVLIEKSLRFSQIKIIKFFLQIFEGIIFWYYSKQFKKRKKINSKFFIYFQLFYGNRISALYRRRKHEILVEKLDLNSEIDNKVYELTKKSYVKLFDLSSQEVKNSVEYFYDSSCIPYVPIKKGFNPFNVLSVRTHKPLDIGLCENLRIFS